MATDTLAHDMLENAIRLLASMLKPGQRATYKECDDKIYFYHDSALSRIDSNKLVSLAWQSMVARGLARIVDVNGASQIEACSPVRELRLMDAPRNLLDCQVIFRGTLAECNAFVAGRKLHIWTWRADKQNLFGGYWRAPNGECLFIT